MQAEATLKRAIIESIVAFSKKTDAILHSAIMVNIALADKQRILSLWQNLKYGDKERLSRTIVLD